MMMFAIMGWVFTGQCLVCSADTSNPDLKTYGITASFIFSVFGSGSMGKEFPVWVKRSISFLVDILYIKSAGMLAGARWIRTCIWSIGIIHLVLTGVKWKNMKSP